MLIYLQIIVIIIVFPSTSLGLFLHLSTWPSRGCLLHVTAELYVYIHIIYRNRYRWHGGPWTKWYGVWNQLIFIGDCVPYLIQLESFGLILHKYFLDQQELLEKEYLTLLILSFSEKSNIVRWMTKLLRHIRFDVIE